jgi:hypothetical protein
MPAGSTYTPIATTTLGTLSTSYTFSSIPTTYTDLILVMAGTAAGDAPYFQVGNGSVDTGSNYSTTSLYGNGSTAGSSRTTNATIGYLGGFVTGIGTSQANIIAHFQNYSNTTTYKTVLSRLSAQQYQVEATVSLWRSTAAINTIKIGIGGTGFAIGSTFTLYGIASA